MRIRNPADDILEKCSYAVSWTVVVSNADPDLNADFSLSVNPDPENQTNAHIRILIGLQGHTKPNFVMKNILYVGIKYQYRTSHKT